MISRKFDRSKDLSEILITPKIYLRASYIFKDEFDSWVNSLRINLTVESTQIEQGLTISLSFGGSKSPTHDYPKKTALFSIGIAHSRLNFSKYLHVT